MPDSDKFDEGKYVYCGGKNLIEDTKQASAIEIINGHLRKLLAVDNVGFLLGSCTSIDARALKMPDLSKRILPYIGKECFSEDDTFWPAVLKSACEETKDFEIPINPAGHSDINIEKVASNLVCTAALSGL
jgi:hypothetical protein